MRFARFRIHHLRHQRNHYHHKHRPHHLVVDSTLLLLVSQVYDEFVRLFADKMNVTAGDPSLPTTKLGPLSSVEARNRLADQASAHA